MNQEEQPLLSHLIELRTRLVRIITGFVVAVFCLFPWRSEIYHVVAKPLLDAMPAGTSMIATDVAAPFFVPVKVIMVVAFLMTLPNTLYQIWAFVAPGLYQHEKRFVLPVVLSSVILFFIGMSFAYFLVFPLVFTFLNAVVPKGVAMATDIDKYLSFVLGMFIAFGVTFEVPVVVVLLTRFGIVSVKKLAAARPYIIVGAFVVAAVVTPPDIFSQFAMALPLWLLYECGLIISRLINKPSEEDETPS